MSRQSDALAEVHFASIPRESGLIDIGGVASEKELQHIF